MVDKSPGWKLEPFVNEIRCQGYEQAIADMVEQFTPLINDNPVWVRAEIRRFVETHK